MCFINSIHEKAKKAGKTIVLSESWDERVIEAAQKAAELGIANIILLGDPKDIKDRVGIINSEKIKIVNPKEFGGIEEYINELVEIRKDKGLTHNDAREFLENPLYFGAMLVRKGDSDGMVTGAATTSSDVLRAALQVVKCKPNTPLVSSCMVMDLSENPYIDTDVWILADCVLNINPTAEQLAIIAVTTAETTKQVLDIEPRVAMLSFSTNGSAKHEFVVKVVEATRIARKLAPGLLIEGEMQLDAAIIKSIGRQKFPGSEIAGEANVLIFPDIQSGNIGYKLVERVGGAKLVGCITQGLNRPVNDLSRGCNSDDIVNSIAITALQAQKTTGCDARYWKEKGQ